MLRPGTWLSCAFMSSYHEKYMTEAEESRTSVTPKPRAAHSAFESAKDRSECRPALTAC